MRALSILPDLRIQAGPARLEVRERDCLAALRVQQRLSLPALIELTFVDPPPDLDLLARFRIGSPLVVDLPEDGPPLFSGEVTAVEEAYGADRGVTVRVRGYDLLHRLRKRQELRTFSGVTAADVAEQLAGPVGLDVRAHESGPRWPQLSQQGQTDFDFLQEVAAEAGLYFAVREGTVHLLTLEGDGKPLDLRVGEGLWQARLEVNADRAAREVTASAWDPRTLEASSGSAGGPRSARDAPAEAPASSVGGADRRVATDRHGPSRDHARAQAQADLDRRAAAEVHLAGVAEGDTRLRPGARVRVEGVSRSLAGTYVVTGVNHVLDEQGHRAEFTTEPPADRRPARPVAVLPATVTAVDDPERRGRVRVEFDVLDGIGSEWMPVALPGAGSDHGLVVLPDVDDRVLVALPHGDAARGIVLGAVFPGTAPDGGGVAGGRVRRFHLRTRDGHQVTLDDEGERLRIEDPSGSHIELAGGAMRIHAEGDLLIEAPGRQVAIVADAVDFRRG